MSTIKILLADDHVVMRRGIRALLERRADFQVVAEAGDGRGAVQLTEIHSPHVGVADIAMPHLNRIEAAPQIAQKWPQTAMLNLSLHTVETHRSNILQKLNLHGTPELILYSIRKGVIS